MFSFLRLVWHRKSLIIGIMILCGLFGYTVASLIKNPYVAQSAFIIETPGSGFYKDLTEIPKTKVTNTAFYKLSTEEQERFKASFKMDTSLTGKLYDRYIGRIVDYGHPYDPGTILSLQYDIEPFALAPKNIKLVFYAPDRDFAVAYSQYLIDAYKGLLNAKYDFVTEDSPGSLDTSGKEKIRIALATREENIRDDAERYLSILFLCIGFLAGCIASSVMEKCRRSETL
ncbi:MAG: hypothetical protein RBR86_03930 [Pseudobdellovibrionaceae bacterium]|jgi:hypothetical protein|nr:hypothetical protein [Pseudobdellovibrionaceae bacterium]